MSSSNSKARTPQLAEQATRQLALPGSEMATGERS